MKEISLFDIIGPIMIGPSSSHTAGALKIAYVARKMGGEDIKFVTFKLYGSFAKTYWGHGTDKALLAGFMGFDTSDYRIKDSEEIAKQIGLNYSFEISNENVPGMHPNTVDIKMEDSKGNVISIRGSSIGGGSINIDEINGTKIEFSGDCNAIYMEQKDEPGTLARVGAILEKTNVNIAFMRVYRDAKGAKAFSLLEIDGTIDDETIRLLSEVRNVNSVKYIKLRG